MNYKELEQKLGKEINISDKVWICDYRYNNIDEKAIRHVPPQEVVIVSNKDLTVNKVVFYSNVHFRPIGKNGNALSRIIAPYDNTGYRTYEGISLNIFFNEEECRNFYREQCSNIENEIKLAKERYDNMFDRMLEELKQEVEEHCKENKNILCLKPGTGKTFVTFASIKNRGE